MKILEWLGSIIQTHITEIGFGITGVILVLASPLINRWTKKICKTLPWLARYLVFVCLCSAGYGLMATFLLQFIRGLLLSQSRSQMALTTIGIYLFLAWIAKRENAI